MWVVADAGPRVSTESGRRGGSRVAMMVGRAIRAVVLHRETIDRPGAGRVRSVAHCNVEVIRTEEPATTWCCWLDLERQDHVDEVPSRLVIDAARIGDERALHNRRAVDRRR